MTFYLIYIYIYIYNHIKKNSKKKERGGVGRGEWVVPDRVD